MLPMGQTIESLQCTNRAMEQKLNFHIGLAFLFSSEFSCSLFCCRQFTMDYGGLNLLTLTQILLMICQVICNLQTKWKNLGTLKWVVNEEFSVSWVVIVLGS